MASVFFWGCSEDHTYHLQSQPYKNTLQILGVMQDAGSPQAGCTRSCCVNNNGGLNERREVVSLAVYDENGKCWLVECTPDVTTQLREIGDHSAGHRLAPQGIFLTHAHIGHYSGLLHLGREEMGAKNIAVYAMPRMKGFLERNGPWSQLVMLENISLKELHDNKTISLSAGISVTPFSVPHRDEFSETVGFVIRGSQYKFLFIPDIDKWEKWNKNIFEEMRSCDYAFIDGTFFSGNELPGRNMKEIPHPLIVETMQLLRGLEKKDRRKVHFIHINHSNPAGNENSAESALIRKEGFMRAVKGMTFSL
jgi:pyrroloquinoline quinone biosynthesis protein B